MVRTILRHFRYVRHPSNSPAFAGQNHLGLPEDTPIDLSGETAMGQWKDDKFVVQVNRFDHPWSHFWHETPRQEWASY